MLGAKPFTPGEPRASGELLRGNPLAAFQVHSLKPQPTLSAANHIDFTAGLDEKSLWATYVMEDTPMNLDYLREVAAKVFGNENWSRVFNRSGAPSGLALRVPAMRSYPPVPRTRRSMSLPCPGKSALRRCLPAKCKRQKNPTVCAGLEPAPQAGNPGQPAI